MKYEFVKSLLSKWNTNLSDNPLPLINRLLKEENAYPSCNFKNRLGFIFLTENENDRLQFCLKLEEIHEKLR